MRLAAGLAGGLLLTVGLAGCDQAQVAQLNSQTAMITVSVVGTEAELFNVWDLRETTDLDMTPGPDDPTVYLYCEAIQVAPGAPPFKVGVQTPWQHSLRISVLRADSTEFEQLTDDMFLDVLSNLTPYDPDPRLNSNNVQKQPLTIPDGTCTVSGTSCLMDVDCLGGASDTCLVILRTFEWDNNTRRQLTTVSRTVILATSNPLNDIDPLTYSFRNGLCSLSTDPGPVALAGAPQPFTFELGKGDTVKVEASKAFTPPAGLRDAFGNPLTLIEPVLRGQLAIDGINITSLGGTANSKPVAGDGFSFFYSSR